MKRQFLKTGDGSITLHLPDWGEQYHSKHGAIAEARHVFVKSGLRHYLEHNAVDTLSLLEIGFGTGLNALLTVQQFENRSQSCQYVALEAYPLALDEISQLNYCEELQIDKEHYLRLHTVPWEQRSEITNNFNITKRKQFFSDFSEENAYNLIYFDAFGARVQPELWTEEIFRKMFVGLKDSGVLVTYSAKGSVRRAMQAVGFIVERLPGPPGKREMLRATKTTKLPE